MLQRLRVSVGSVLGPVIASTQVVFVCLRDRRVSSRIGIEIRRCDGEAHRNVLRNRFGDLALQGQHVSYLPLVLSGPDVTLVSGFYQLHGDSDAASCRPYTALEKVVHT